jgi:hypothetical protein
VPIVSTNASAECACSPVAEGDGVGEAVGVGDGAGEATGEGAGSGRYGSPEWRERAGTDVSTVVSADDEAEDCPMVEEAIRAIPAGDVDCFWTTLQATALKIRAIAIRQEKNDREQDLHKVPKRKEVTSYLT